MKKQKDIEIIEDGKWYPLNKNETIICCDCSLVHKITIGKKGTKLYAKWVRDERRTALHRRGKEAKSILKDIFKKLKIK